MAVAIRAAPERDDLGPVSPELALVDPELRSALQKVYARPALHVVPGPVPVAAPTRLEPEARSPVFSAPAVEVPLPGAEVSRAPTRRAGRLTGIVLTLSLTLNAILIALAWSDARARDSAAPTRPLVAPAPQPPASLRPTTTPTTHPSPAGSSRSPSSTSQRHVKTRRAAAPRLTKSESKARRRAAALARARRGAVERKLLNVIVRSPAGKLPAALIDSRTGLAKNNLQAVCRSSSGGGFLCLVRPAQHRPGEGLYVAYKPGKNGEGTFKWYSYRSGT